MITLIIVDDEKNIRNQLRDIFEWLSDEIATIGTFSNVKSTLEFLKSNHVDIILTDIVMKEESGLDIAKYVQENHLNTKVILLSAHSKFSFAQAALSYNAFYYLTKPINIDALRRVTEKTIACIKEESRRETAIKEQYMLDILSNDFDISGYSPSSGFSACMIYIKLLNPENISSKYEVELTLTNFFSLCRSTIKYSVLRVTDSTAYVLAFSFSPNKHDFAATLGNEISKIKNDLNELFGITSDITIAKSFSSVPDMINHFFRIRTDDSFTSDFLINSIAERIYSENTNEAMAAVSSIIDLIDSADGGASFVSSLLTALGGADAAKKLSGKSKAELKDAVSAYFKSMKNLPGNSSIDAALDYINRNYMNHISRTTVADYINMNPSYFSSFFQQKTGSRFSDYLLNLRISKAKELMLKSTLSINAIAKTVGYANTEYFHKLFKANEGCTPSEYISNNKGQTP